MAAETWKIATYNCASIRARLEFIGDWLARHPVDVLCLQETKVEDRDFPLDAIHGMGYSAIFHGERGRNGVAILSRRPATAPGWGLDDDGPPDGSRLIFGMVDSIPVINIYAPQGRTVYSPEFQYKLAWQGRLRDFVARNYSPSAPLVIVGDFNVAPEPIDVYNPTALGNSPDFHPLARAGLERLREWGLVDVVRLHRPDEAGLYTYWDYRFPNAIERGLGWRIDHVWATPPLAERSVAAWVDVEARLAPRPSDHTLVVAEFTRQGMN